MVLLTNKSMTFYHPCTNDEQPTLANEHSYRVQIGAKLIPEYPINSLAESYSQLRKAVGQSFNMRRSWYRSREYIIGLDLGKISSAGFTESSTTSGALLTLNFKGCDALNNASSVPDRVFCALNYDCVLNTQGSGIQLLG